MFNCICTTCGVQYTATAEPPESCPICEDERQYVNPAGQQWTTLEELRAAHHNTIEWQEPYLAGIGTEPKFAIGQRALLLQTPAGNMLWDCISLLDAATVAAIRELGGIAAIAISHPHFYASMVEWSHAFGDAPIYLHADDREWVMRPAANIRFWEGESHQLVDGVTLVRCGGHFAGSSVLHWAGGADGRGALLTGDTIQVIPDHRYVTFMRSYPNQIPLNRQAIEIITQAVEPLAFDRLYGGWFPAVVKADAKGAVLRSARRYIEAITG